MNSLFYRELKPEGWLLRQLRIQACGLSGHLHEFWPDIQDSAWIGGSREGWERVPYWLDGLIPLAYLLHDAGLIGTAERYISAIIARQQPDGWICPCSDDARRGYDIWAALLIGKVLAQYCAFTDDPAAEDALYRAMKNLHDCLKEDKIRLFDWGKFRWFEGMIPLLYLKMHHPDEKWIADLGHILKEQGTDYESLSHLWKRPMNKWTFETHIVNLCMMLKYEAVSTALLGGAYEDKAEALWQVLEAYNGTAVGTFTGDECLSGLGNNQGTELCAVVELMYTLEWLYRTTGKQVWAERLEKVAFNALPATFTDDMWAHQYDQMVNQPACITFPGKSFFRTNNSEAHLFGLEPHYGCCTANMHQGWPKLVMHAIQRTGRGMLCAHLLPVSIGTQINGQDVSIRIDSEYPFRMHAAITVTAERAVAFELKIRIPSWAQDVRIDKETAAIGEDGCISLDRIWQGRHTLSLTMRADARLVRRPSTLYSAEYGPLVFSLPVQAEYRQIEYTRDGVARRAPYCDYELSPASEWRFGFAEQVFQVIARPINATPFSSQHPPLALRAAMARVAWDWADGYDSVPAVRPVSDCAEDAPQEILLIPYGCAKLRMTEMPLLK